jgi:hypothetical protein
MENRTISITNIVSLYSNNLKNGEIKYFGEIFILFNDLEKLLYKEIGKVSYIRDKKIQAINLSIRYTLLIIFLFILLFISFIII